MSEVPFHWWIALSYGNFSSPYNFIIGGTGIPGFCRNGSQADVWDLTQRGRWFIRKFDFQWPWTHSKHWACHQVLTSALLWHMTCFQSSWGKGMGRQRHVRLLHSPEEFLTGRRWYPWLWDVRIVLKSISEFQNYKGGRHNSLSNLLKYLTLHPFLLPHWKSWALQSLREKGGDRTWKGTQV